MIRLEMQGRIFASGLLRQLMWLYGHGSLGFTGISVGSPSFLLCWLFWGVFLLLLALQHSGVSLDESLHSQPVLFLRVAYIEQTRS